MKMHTIQHKQTIILHRTVTAAVVILIVSATFGCVFGPPKPAEIFDQAVTIIAKNYVDASGNSVNLDISKRPDIGSLLTQLDSPAQLINSEEVTVTGESTGIGIQVQLKKGSWIISKTFRDGPAYDAGLHRGDKIVEINDELTEGFSATKLISKLHGDPGSEVVLKIVTPQNETKTVKITRQIVVPDSVQLLFLNNKRIGYIRIQNFVYTTPKEVDDAVKRFLEQKTQGLVLDIRDNTGGLLNAVTETTELFLVQNAPIIRLVGNKQEKEKTFKALGGKLYTNIPLVVIIDKNTASGAEILAAALKENRRALLIGEKTAGKGDIDTVYPLKDGSLLRIRTFHMRTIAGEAIEGRGVKPDVELVVPEEEKEKLYDNIYSYSEMKLPDSNTDIQFKTAEALLSEQIEKNKTEEK